MLHKRYSLTILLSCLLASPSLSHAARLDCDGAKALAPAAAAGELEKVQTTYSAVKGMRAQFVQRSYSVALDEERASKGTVIYGKPGKMRWSYTEPEQQQFLLKQPTVWFYQPKEKQLLIEEIDQVVLSDLPVGFLMGLGDLSRDFTVRSACRKEGTVVFALAPRAGSGGTPHQGSGLQEFRLAVDEGRYLPTAALVTDIGGNSTTIYLNSIERDPAFGTRDFEPGFPRGLDVTDNRARGGVTADAPARPIRERDLTKE